MKIDYKIKEVQPNIFAVIVKDKYDLAMLFCRAQEYYESPNKKFNGKTFDFWDYMKWYAKKYKKGFSYMIDWSGFNIPLEIIQECYHGLDFYFTPYDEHMNFIMDEIEGKGDCRLPKYIIGCNDIKGETFQHEICHAKYSIDGKYKAKKDNLIKQIDKKHLKIFKNNLLKMGYARKVINDEIQAYLQYGYEMDCFGKGVEMKYREKYNKLFK